MTWVQSLGWEDLLEEGMATHSGILTWRIAWTKEPDGLQSMVSQSRTCLKRFTLHTQYILNCFVSKDKGIHLNMSLEVTGFILISI